MPPDRQWWRKYPRAPPKYNFVEKSKTHPSVPGLLVSGTSDIYYAER